MLISDNKRRWAQYHIPSNSAHIGPNSAHIGPNSAHIPISTLLTLEEEELLRTFSIKRRSSPAEIQRIIHQLCKGKYRTAAELGKILQRSTNNLRFRHLAKMVAEGKLTLQYPENIHGPDQAYTATAGE